MRDRRRQASAPGGDGAAGVGEHEGVAAVGLGFTRVEVGSAAHHQSGRVGDRDAPASGDCEHEARKRGGLVHDQRRAADRRHAVISAAYVRSGCSGVAILGPSKARSPDQVVECSGSLVLLPGQHVSVDIHRER